MRIESIWLKTGTSGGSCEHGPLGSTKDFSGIFVSFNTYSFINVLKKVAYSFLTQPYPRVFLSDYILLHYLASVNYLYCFFFLSF